MLKYCFTFLVVGMMAILPARLYAASSITDGMNADDEIGQYDAGTTTSLVTIFTKKSAGNPSKLTLNRPEEIVIDGVHQKAYVIDPALNRIMVYNTNSDGTLPDRIADFVIGQSDFNGVDSTPVSASSLSSPSGMGLDITGQRLFVADSGNNRVLVFDVSSLSNGLSATAVLGQSLFTTNSSGTTSTTLSFPSDVAFDSSGNRLFVSDRSNNRTLIYDVASITNGEAAVNVLGQANFTSSSATGNTSTNMRAPNSVTYRSSGSLLFVAQTTGRRVTVYDVASITDGEAAVNVLGQATFTGTSSGVTSQLFSSSGPDKVDLDTGNNRLFVTDSANNRVMIFDVASIADGEVAVNVLGQSNFTSNTAATTSSGLRTPKGVGFDASHNILHVGDQNNGRDLLFDVTSITDGEASIDEIGQYDADASDPFSYPSIFTKRAGCTSSVQNVNRFGMSFNSADLAGVVVDTTHHRLFVSDYRCNRVLVFNLNTNNTLVDKIPDFILGQSSYNTSTSATTQSGLNNPAGLAYDSTNNRLFVADSANVRVMVYDVASITNGENAVNVLGQTLFTTTTASTTSSTFGGSTYSLAYDSTNNRLFAGDPDNNRILVFDVASISDGEAAVNVLGQADFTSNASGTTQSTFNSPYGGLSYDRSGTLLYVGDFNNRRVLVFNVASITNGQNAVNVLGQANFTSSTAATTQAGMNKPVDVFYESAERYLYVADHLNNRVLVYDVAAISDGENAVNVLGQANFTSSTAATTQSGLSSPTAFGYDSSRGKLYVVDAANARIMSFGVATVSSSGASSGGGSSNVVFCGSSSRITLISPTSGTFTAGDTLNLTWGYTSCAATALRVSYSVDNAQTFVGAVNLVQFQNGRYGWVIPPEIVGPFVIRLELLDISNAVLASAMSDTFMPVSVVPETAVVVEPSNDAAEGTITPNEFFALPIPETIEADLGVKSLPQGNGLACIPGSHIKVSRFDTVYLCGSDGKRYVFPHYNVYLSWYGDFSRVVTISDVLMASIPLAGKNIHYKPGANLIKILSVPKVYVVSDGGILHWVTSAAIAETMFGKQWASKVQDLNDVFFIDYQVGEDIR